MVRLLWTLTFILVNLYCFTQNGDIQGYVYDKKDKTPIASAYVKLLDQDSTYIKGSLTTEKGKFNISTKKGNYILEFSYLGYKTSYLNISLTNDQPSISKDSIFLETSSILLDGALITTQIPDVRVKGDTIEYNARGYNVEEGAVLQDLIKKIPGIEIDSKGNVSANGKPINKILVDGKEFFSDDIKVALQNLPVEMINKLQLYKEPSEMSKLTGVKDGDEQQVINLTVKEEIKQSIFGSTDAGYGTDDKYNVQGIVNYMKGESQYSVVGDLSNAPDDGGYGGMMGGIETNGNLGGRFNYQKSKDFSLNGSIYYRKSDMEDESLSNTQTFLETGDRFNTQNSRSNNISKDLGINMYMSWSPDTLTNIFARVGFQNSKRKMNRSSDYISYVEQNDSSRTDGWTKGFTENTNHSWNFSVAAGRKLNNKGRSINLSLSTSLRNGDSDGTNLSETKYSNISSPDLIINQILKSTDKSTAYSMSLAYVEPIGKNKFLQARYSYNTSKSDRDNNTYKQDNNSIYSVIDTAYTRQTKNDFTGQNFDLSFQSTNEKYNYTIGISANPSTSKNNIWFRDSLLEKVTQSVLNYSPNLRFSWQPKDGTSLSVDYSGSTSRPTLGQLSADTTILNAQSKTVGNPNLKPGYRNHIGAYFSMSNFEKMTFLNISGSFGFSVNDIVSNTTIDKDGNSVNTYNNVNGNINSNLNVSYTTPFRNKKFTFTTSSMVMHSRNKGFTNGVETKTDNYVFVENLNLAFTADKFNFNTASFLSYSIAKNNLTNQGNINYTSVGLSGSFSWSLPHNFKLTSNAEFSYNSGYSDGFSPSSLVWNAKIGKQFLRKKKGALSFAVYDMLNDRNNLVRTVTSSNIVDYKTNTIGRYCMLSFSYKFTIFKGNSREAEEYPDYY